MTPETFLDGRVTLHAGDCLDVLKTLATDSIDSSVTDPPYHLTSIVKRFGASNAAAAKDYTGTRSGATGAYARASKGFMGRTWDGGDIAFRAELWVEVLRVLKPGAHLIAFGGTRTYHRMACAIEDAGFEIRDCCSWNFGSGFPKSHNISKVLANAEKCCTCDQNVRSVRNGMEAAHALSGGSQQDVLSGLQPSASINRNAGPRRETADDPLSDVREIVSPTGFTNEAEREGLLQRVLPQQDVRGPPAALCSEREGQELSWQGNEGCQQPGMEGWCDLSESPRELCEREICSVPGGSDLDVSDGRLCNGTSLSHGEVGETSADADRVCTSPRPSSFEQSEDESGTVALQPQPQKRGAWDRCGRCGKPIVSDGLGTTLKPAMELIALARKPLSESTVAANVLKWGTGALNIDGCRVAIDADAEPYDLNGKVRPNIAGVDAIHGGGVVPQAGWKPGNGRWPANVIHDGSEEVVGAFPDARSAGDYPSDSKTRNGVTNFSGDQGPLYADSGSAARFFYTAKADADDRLGSKHPTVKPLDLMQYLVRLVTPPKGLVLDLFAGTGTTGEAAWREGFNAVLIEREEEYQNDIRRRMKLAASGPQERARESIKAKTKDKPIDHGPLFGGTTPPAAQADRYTDTSQIRTDDRTNRAEMVSAETSDSG